MLHEDVPLRDAIRRFNGRKIQGNTTGDYLVAEIKPVARQYRLVFMRLGSSGNIVLLSAFRKTGTENDRLVDDVAKQRAQAVWRDVTRKGEGGK